MEYATRISRSAGKSFSFLGIAYLYRGAQHKYTTYQKSILFERLHFIVVHCSVSKRHFIGIQISSRYYSQSAFDSIIEKKFLYIIINYRKMPK